MKMHDDNNDTQHLKRNLHRKLYILRYQCKTKIVTGLYYHWSAEELLCLFVGSATKYRCYPVTWLLDINQLPGY